MARPKKKNTEPHRAMEQLLERAAQLFEEPYDDRDERDSELPSLRSVADELDTTILRARKLLITADMYSTQRSRTVQKMIEKGKSVAEIIEKTGLKKASINSYLPYRNLAFNLDETTVNADRHRIFRKRSKAVTELQEHIGLPDESIYLWKAIIAFQHYPFQTPGRGKDHSGSVKFSYEVSAEGKTCDRHYGGETVPGYGNELWVTVAGGKKEKSISRSTVDLALQNALEEQTRCGFVSGSRKLGVPESQSCLYAMFLRFGVIMSEAQKKLDNVFWKEQFSLSECKAVSEHTMTK